MPLAISFPFANLQIILSGNQLFTTTFNYE